MCVTSHPTLLPPSLLAISPSAQKLLLSDLYVTANSVPEDEGPGSGKTLGHRFCGQHRQNGHSSGFLYFSYFSRQPRSTWAFLLLTGDPTWVWHWGPGSAAGLWVGLQLMTLEPTHLASWLTLGGAPEPPLASCSVNMARLVVRNCQRVPSDGTVWKMP